MEDFDCVVVGAGVGGLAAALFLARARRSTMLFDAGGSTILSVEHVREYLGFDGVKPQEMLRRAREEVFRYPAVRYREEAVLGILPLADGSFEVSSAKLRIRARSVVLATGETYELPDISGIPEPWGRDLRVCPCFDGHEVIDGKFVVFGLSERLAQLASWVSMWSSDVTVVTPGVFDAAQTEQLQLMGIRVLSDEVTGLVHRDGRLRAVAVRGGAEVPCDATWVALAAKAASGLAASLCDVDQDGFAITDASGATTRPGVFAVGNASQPWDHLAHAAAAGTRVGPVVTNYLLQQRIRDLRASRGEALPHAGAR